MTKKEILKIATNGNIEYLLNKIRKENDNLIHKTELEQKSALKRIEHDCKLIQEYLKG